MSISTDVETALTGYNSPAGRRLLLERDAANHWGQTGANLEAYDPEVVTITGETVETVLRLAALVRVDGTSPAEIRARLRSLKRPELEAALILLLRTMPDTDVEPEQLNTILARPRPPEHDLTREDRRALHRLARTGPGIASGEVAGRPLDTINATSVLNGGPARLTGLERILLLELVAVAGGWRSTRNPRGYSAVTVAAALGTTETQLLTEYRAHVTAQREALAR